MINIGECCTCKCEVWIPDDLHAAASHSKFGGRQINFYCAYGHSMVFAKGETELDKMRRERDRLAQRVAQKDDQILDERRRREEAERSAAAQKGQVTKLKNRVSRGVCPCCNRSFTDLRRHMNTKHPDFTPGKPELKIVA